MPWAAGPVAFAGMKLDARGIKARIDLVEYLTSLGIELKPVGPGGEYRGLCPFHKEVEPSFQVNRQKGLWHCFGCGAGGDVISFVRKRGGVGFREALTILAGPGGKERGYILAAAADYWHKRLAGSRSARRYIERRGIGSPEIVERYGIGFAPGRTRTRDWLLGKGFTPEEIESAGLVNIRGLDSFFGRVTFPLVEDGKVVNIYGRSLSDRYRHMYLPGSRDVIFNIENISGQDATLTESIIDALSLLALGYENVVSSLSVHLTPRQVDLLVARFSRIEIVYDGDAAGEKGAARVAELLAGRGIDIRIVSLPGGSDINSLVMGGATHRDFEKILQQGS